MTTHVKLKTKSGATYGPERVLGLVLNERGIWFDVAIGKTSEEVHSRGYRIQDLEMLEVVVVAEDDDDLPF